MNEIKSIAPEINPQDDALLTFIGLMRIMTGSVPDPKFDASGDFALERLYGRFAGREALLFEASCDFIGFLLEQLDASDGDKARTVINDYVNLRTAN